MPIVMLMVGTSFGAASAQTSCLNTPLTTSARARVELLPDLISGQCRVISGDMVNVDDQLRIEVYAPGTAFGSLGSRLRFHAFFGGEQVLPSSLVVEGAQTFVQDFRFLGTSSIDVGSHTAIGTATLGGTDYTIEMQFTFTETEAIIESVVITGGAFVGPPATESGNSERRQASANKVAGAAFGRASNATQRFATQTQTQNRLLNGRAGSGNGAASSVALAGAYGRTIRRPQQSMGQTAWALQGFVQSLP